MSENTWALEKLIDESSWETKEEYGPYGSYYAHVWTGDAPPLDDASAELAKYPGEIKG